MRRRKRVTVVVAHTVRRVRILIIYKGIRLFFMWKGENEDENNP